MNAAMSHQDARESLALAALDALSPEERAALEAHVAGCAACAGELAALRDAAASVGGVLPAVAMTPERSEQVRARLLARARADRQGVVPIRASAPASISRTRMLAAAAVIVVAAGVAAYAVGERQRADRLAGEVAQLREERKRLSDSIAGRQALVDALTGPGVKVIDAAATGPQKPSARMFWDQPANRWTFIAYNVPALAAGRTYQLWLVTKDQRKVSAGTFTPGAGGDAFVRATYALPRDQLAAIAVTEEPAGGSPQPTSTPFLVGVAGKTD